MKKMFLLLLLFGVLLQVRYFLLFISGRLDAEHYSAPVFVFIFQSLNKVGENNAKLTNTL